MGLVGSLAKLVFARLVPGLVLLVVIVVGWSNMESDKQIPEGRFFAALIPLLKGYLPPLLVGHGRMVGTPPVPDSMTPEPRPANEAFVQLRTGDPNITYPMPAFGLGMCCRPTAYDDVMVERSVLWFLLLGGRMIDGADLYLNHEAIGKGIHEAISRGIPREEIFVTTKVFPSHFGYNSTMEVVPKMLKELNLDYVDMMLMHAPSRFAFFPAIAHWMGTSECREKGLTHSECRKETWKALTELREQGLVRNVGVSNFAKSHLEELQTVGGAPIANNQIQFNPWLSDEWMETANYCHDNGIAITGYNSLGGSLQHHETSTITVLTDLAASYDKSVAQIMLRWAMQHKAIVIPGTGNPKYMKENMGVYDFALSTEDMAAIDGLRSSDAMAKFFQTPAAMPEE